MPHAGSDGCKNGELAGRETDEGFGTIDIPDERGGLEERREGAEGTGKTAPAILHVGPGSLVFADFVIVGQYRIVVHEKPDLLGDGHATPDAVVEIERDFDRFFF